MRSLMICCMMLKRDKNVWGLWTRAPVVAPPFEPAGMTSVHASPPTGLGSRRHRTRWRFNLVKLRGSLTYSPFPFLLRKSIYSPTAFHVPASRDHLHPGNAIVRTTLRPRPSPRTTNTLSTICTKIIYF